MNADIETPDNISREETSEHTKDNVAPSINDEVPDIEINDIDENNNDGYVEKPKRAKISKVWDDIEEIRDQDGAIQICCKHCKKSFKKPKSGATSHLKRHLAQCDVKLRADALEKRNQSKQTRLNFPMGSVNPSSVPALHDGKVDFESMKVDVAQWILVHELPFSSVEDELFNMMARKWSAEWRAVSRVTIKAQCVKIYEMEKKRLKNELKTVNKMSITTDCWKSKNKKHAYMVITGHWIDQDWRLQKRVLNFVYIPPPRRGVDIANAIWRCLEEWGIEAKLHTVSVDNAFANDSAIEILKVFIRRKIKLLCGGSLFHVRCCAHIFNLIAQDGLSVIKDVIDCVRDSVDYVRRSDSRLKVFTGIVKQLSLRERRLIDDCKTRWNSTYEMLGIAIKFKDVFPRFAERDPNYLDCPSIDDWERVEKVCSILEVFWTATHIISGSYYPTSNLFLHEVFRVKMELDSKSRSSDFFIQSMVERMKLKFDKYWGETNLLMAIASILDPRYKMMALEFFFSKIYSHEKAMTELAFIRRTLKELYNEYASLCSGSGESSTNRQSGEVARDTDYMSELACFMKEKQSNQPQKSELDMYLEENIFVEHEKNKNGTGFDVLEWWKIHAIKYNVLSTMARDILAIPITAVASESTFSAGSRVVDKYRSRLSSETIEVLICGSDWLRNRYGIKKKLKEKKKSMEVILPVEVDTTN